MKDIALHSLAAFLLTLLALAQPTGLVIAMTLMWLLRELAQRDSGNLFAALQSMPEWSIAKHAEWLAPGVAAALAIAIQGPFWGAWKGLLTPL